MEIPKYDLRTNGRPWVGARDTWVSKKDNDKDKDKNKDTSRDNDNDRDKDI